MKFSIMQMVYGSADTLRTPEMQHDSVLSVFFPSTLVVSTIVFNTFVVSTLWLAQFVVSTMQLACCGYYICG